MLVQSEKFSFLRTRCFLSVKKLEIKSVMKGSKSYKFTIVFAEYAKVANEESLSLVDQEILRIRAGML